MNKLKVALMTYSIDGRKAKGTAIVARKCAEALIGAKDNIELTFIHYENSNDPIYSYGVREVIFPEFRWRFLNRRSLRQIYYFLTTKDRFDIIHWFQPRLYPFFWFAPAKYLVVTLNGAGDIAGVNHFDFMRQGFYLTFQIF